METCEIELGGEKEKELQDEGIWVPKTPAKSKSVSLNSEDTSSASTFSSPILANQYNRLIQSDEEAVNGERKTQQDKTKKDKRKKVYVKSASRSILTLAKKVYIRKRIKSNIRRKFRPKVVKEGKVNKTPKIKTPNPKTPKPCTPKPPNSRSSKSRICNKTDTVSGSENCDMSLPSRSCNKTGTGFDDSFIESQDASPSHCVSPSIPIEAIDSAFLGKICDDMSVDLKPQAELRSCKRALNFNQLSENDQIEQTKDTSACCASGQGCTNNYPVIVYQRRSKLLKNQSAEKDLNFSCASSCRDPNSYPMLVYRRRLKLKSCGLLNYRKLGPDFPKVCRKKRTQTQRNLTSSNLITSLLALGTQNGTIRNPLESAITIKDSKLLIIRKSRSPRKRKVFPNLPSISEINKVPKLPVPLFTPNLRRIDASTQKLYTGILSPCLGPPLKKLRGVEGVIKRFQRLHIDDIGRLGGRKKDNSSDVKKFGELVLHKPKCDQKRKKDNSSDVKKFGELVLRKPKKQIPKVDIDEETEREFNLLMQIFCGGAEEEKGEDRKKWWEEQRKALHVRMLLFVSVMHIIQGDRRFSEWKGSVVDSVVGVFLTQNVSDQLSSSAFISLASRFPIKHSDELECIKSFFPKSLPIIQEAEPQNCENNTPLEGESVITVGTPSNTTERHSDENQANPKDKLQCLKSCYTESVPTVKEAEPQSYETNPPLEGESVIPVGTPSTTTEKTSDKNQANTTNWDELRKTYANGAERKTSERYADSVDWEAVRKAPPGEVSDAIKMRGQNVILGEKIQDFLNRLVKDHECIDLEWLRNVPPDKAKEYLLSFNGLGLKSVECIRLLCLHHKAFPVDINVARVAVRLGWVPLEPLPGGLEFHLLEEYPLMDKVQVYLWPRLCTLDQETLYELHYQLITFGKVFCKKKNPSCGTCPLKAECKHYASAVASSKLSLPGTAAKSRSRAVVSISDIEDIEDLGKTYATAAKSFPGSSYQSKNVEPIIEYPPSPLHVSDEIAIPDIEDWYGQTVEVDDNDDMDMDMGIDVHVNLIRNLNMEENVNGDDDGGEDEGEEEGNDYEDEDVDAPTIRLGTEEGIVTEDDTPILRLDKEDLRKSFREAMHACNINLPEDDVSKALVALSSEAASTPAPKLKNVGRLKTVHCVYELPDSHPILAGVEKREPDDVSPYLLVIWASDADASQNKTSKKQSCSGRLELCDVDVCCSSSSMEGQQSETVLGTLMIPCRTATKGRFPLNGTYFQVNEVFADDKSAEHPIQVPRKWLWNLRRRLLYCGRSASAIFTGCSLEEIQQCFWRGFICVRAFNRSTRAPVVLPEKFHVITSSKGKAKDT